MAILLRRGLKTNLPSSAPAGQPLLTTDTDELYFGDGSSIVPLQVEAANIIGRVSGIAIGIDGGGSTPGTGVLGQVSVPFSCTITGWTLSADQSGDAVIDVQLATYSGFPTFNSIADSTMPTLSSAQIAENLNVSATWTTAVVATDILQFVLLSVSTVTRLNLTINITIP